VFSTSTQHVSEASDESVDLGLLVHVLDIDLHEKLATVQIEVVSFNFPYNRTDVHVDILGGGFARISFDNVGKKGVNKWHYYGESNQTAWFLHGPGEAFPFDSYRLYFIIAYISHVGGNFSLDQPGALFDGPKCWSLVESWRGDEAWIPIDYAETKKVEFIIERTNNALLLAAIQFIVPIIVCYYLLGATLMLAPKKQLAQRLAIYLSLFVFVPSFFMGIQTFLPSRSSICLPELLLTNLIISNTLFGIFSIIGNRRASSEPTYVVKLWKGSGSARLKKVLGYHNIWDLLASILAYLFFIWVYYFQTLSTIVSSERIFISLLFPSIVYPSYAYWRFFVVSKEQISRILLFEAIFDIILFSTPILLWVLWI